MDPKFIEAASTAFSFRGGQSVVLGAAVLSGECTPEPIVALPVAMTNRHGLISGATGTGKTRTLQVIAEQLSRAGVPVFLADVKGDLSGIATPGEENDRVKQRAKETGFAWSPVGCPVEYLSLTGKSGAQLRATVSSFGPLLLSKVLSLNDTQSGALTVIFRFCDERRLPLLDLSDLRAVLQYFGGDGWEELSKAEGGVAKSTIGVLQRKIIELEEQGATEFFGEPEFDLNDLLQTRDGAGLVSLLELSDAQDKPVLWSTFMMWLLARLYHELPEIGDVDRPKLVFFLDEAHLLFDDASEAFRDSVEQVVRLIRSKGVGVFFITQSPKDIPPEILGQIGNRAQHALHAFTPDDEKGLRAAARTFPKTSFYDVEAVLQNLAIGEALVTVLAPSGAPTQPFVTRVIPPASRMGPLADAEMNARLAASEQVREYAKAIDRESAREMLSARMPGGEAAPAGQAPASGQKPSSGSPQRGTIEEILRSPVTRTVAGQITRGLLGALLRPPPRRRRRW